MAIILKINNPDLEEQLGQFVKQQKQNVEDITVEALEFFINTFHKKQKKYSQKIDIDALPSSVDKYIGIVDENEIDMDYKNNRANYLIDKYL